MNAVFLYYELLHVSIYWCTIFILFIIYIIYLIWHTLNCHDYNVYNG